LRRVGRLEQRGGVRLVTLGDGLERGVRLLEFRTGTGFEFDVVVDRAFDVGRCSFRGDSLTWLSPTGVVGPWYAEPRGLGWLRSWGGGMLVTCGLDHALIGAVDDVSHFHQDLRQTEDYGLHGRIGYLPAQLAGYGEYWDGDTCVLWAEGVVRQTAVFGEALELRRRIESRLGESRFTVNDQVTNVGFAPTTHMLLYHVNVGWPVVDDGSEYLVPAAAGVPVADGYPAEDYRILHEPRANMREQCFEHDVRAEPDGIVPVAVVNRARGLGVYELYKRDQLPFHMMWRMLGEGTYAVAIEPMTNRSKGRLDARERGELLFVNPGEERHYDLEIGVLDGTDEIAAFSRRVDRAIAE
jgi:hypothetical protein